MRARRPVVTDGEDGLGRAARERKREYRRIARVFHAVAHELSEQETQPAPVGEYGLVCKLPLDTNVLFLQQRAVIVEHLVDAAAQCQALEPIVAPRAAQARIVEHLVNERLHPVACVVELEADRLRSVSRRLSRRLSSTSVSSASGVFTSCAQSST